MSDLSLAWVGGGTYIVYSPSDDGDSNAYTVELDADGPECNCEHGEHKGGTAACKHIREAVKAHLTHPDLEHTIMQEWAGVVRDANDTLSKAEAALKGAEEANVNARDAEAHAKAQASTAGDSDTDDDSGVSWDTQAAADRLQEAFDEHLNDMQVQAHADHVWFKTGYETEEEWPYPGVDETFQAVTAPDVVEYVSDGGGDYPAHDLYDEKPGEYWKNALHPSDVEEYISEVLE